MKFNILTVILIILYYSSNEYIDKLIETLNSIEGRGRLVDFIDKGSMDGFLFLNEFWEIVHNLQAKYPHHISSKIPFGKTHLGREIYSYYIGNNLVNTFFDYNNKNIIYFTALNKPNEAITLSMLYYIFLVNLHQLIHKTGESFFKNNIILFIPAIDIDNYLNINELYGSINWVYQYINYQKNNMFFKCFK